jgi:hypothetical protein
MAASYKHAQIKIEGPDLYEIRQAFKQLPTNIAARVIGAGLKRAAKPGENALKQLTPKGPTGNLRRSIRTMVKRYPRDGAAVAVVGFVKPGTGASKSAQGGKVQKGPDRGFHQFWMEFGTDERYIGVKISKRVRRLVGKKAAKALLRASYAINRNKKGSYIASSFNKLGPFVLKPSPGGGRVQTSPKYPKAFFKKSATPIVLPGVGSQHLVHRAYASSKSAIAGNLRGEMTKAVENGLKILEDQARRAAQMRDLGQHL